MLSIPQILSNRNRIRKQLKGCLVTPMIHLKINKLQHQKDSNFQIKMKKRQNERKVRKQSQDLQNFENGNKLKQHYISQNFSDLFQVQEKLGQGAQSVVKKCRQIMNDKIYAVKFFRRCDNQLVQILKNQYKLLKSLQHSNIIQAKYLFINEKLNNSQLVLEYCDFPCLRNILKKESKLSEQFVLGIITKILNILIYLHQKGISHRDLKPDNILYDPSTENIKLIDFQIAKQFRSSTQRIQMWTQTGTLYYKAPQMFAGSYNQMIDIWALGIMCYEMIKGELPFEKQYVSDLITDINTNQPNLDGINGIMQKFISKCLNKNPLLRPTAKEAYQLLINNQFESTTQESQNSDYLSKRFEQINSSEKIGDMKRTLSIVNQDDGDMMTNSKQHQ